MTAPVEPPLRPTKAQAREMAELYARIDELNQKIDDLRDQRDAARRTVGQQQDEYSALRPRQLRQPRPVVRDVPTGEAL